MTGISTSAPIAHDAPTSALSAPMSTRWIEKKALMAMFELQTSRMASRNGPMTGLRRTAPMPARCGAAATTPACPRKARPIKLVTNSEPASTANMAAIWVWSISQPTTSTLTMKDPDPQTRSRL